MSKIPSISVGVLYVDYLVGGVGNFDVLIINGVPVGGQTLQSVAPIELTFMGAVQTGPTMKLRDLSAGTGISLTPAANTITIDNTGPGGPIPPMDNAQAPGVAIFSILRNDAAQPETPGDDYFVKTWTAGPQFDIVSTGNNLTLSATGAAGGATMALEPTATGTSIIGDGWTVSAHLFKGLKGATGEFAVTVVGEDLTPNLVPSGVAAAAYTNTNLTVTSKGITTTAANGVAGIAGGANSADSFLTVLDHPNLTGYRKMNPIAPVSADLSVPGQYRLRLTNPGAGVGTKVGHIEFYHLDPTRGLVQEVRGDGLFSFKRPLVLRLQDYALAYPALLTTPGTNVFLFRPADTLDINFGMLTAPFAPSGGLSGSFDFGDLNTIYGYDHCILDVHVMGRMSFSGNSQLFVEMFLRRNSDGALSSPVPHQSIRIDSEHTRNINYHATFPLLLGQNLVDDVSFGFRWRTFPSGHGDASRVGGTQTLTNAVLALTVIEKYITGT